MEATVWAVVTAVNFGTASLLAVLCACAVMARSVRDGVAMKLGLILMSIGHAATAARLSDGLQLADLMLLDRARFACNLGLLIVLAGYAWRHWRGERLDDIVPPLFGGRR